ncbi:uncharacterized protein PAC_18243 [Phialocephala subalpina]|uniref:Uncharacterized protein n=1 Tax=Phialocephala subalpina TaxID=576137 RepID=A0A1L7XTH7_9HELO|nr:uncharacterized protein PAC_18243 [Phialocephala subalpina]
MPNPSTKFPEKAPDSVSALLHNREARSPFANMLGKNMKPDGPDYLSIITSHLDNILIERQDGDITRNMQIFFGSTNFELTLQLLRYSVYLSSNNLLEDDQTDKLLRWIVRSDQFAAVEYLIKLKTSTSLIFASNMLLSAIRTKSHAALQALIALGIDINIPGGAYPKKTALWQAAEISSRFYTYNERNFSLVRLLLDAGADIYVKSPHNNTSPLQYAMAGKKIKLVQILLNFGVVGSAPRDECELPSAALLQAARDGDLTVVDRLLNRKTVLDPLKQPSMITLLQDATRWCDIDDVQSLLESGADVNAPAGVCYENARKKAISSRNFQHLHSPVQIAASIRDLEMVLVLLEAGANVDGYFLTEEESLAHEITATGNVEADNGDAYEDYSGSATRMTTVEAITAIATMMTIAITLVLMNQILYQLRKRLEAKYMSAVARRNGALALILLQAGANVEGLGRGPTPLQLAAMKDDDKLVKLLLRKGAAVNSPAHGVKGRTALQAAVRKCNLGMVEILMDAGADVNAVACRNKGRTALQVAAQVKSFALVNKLVSIGADINAVASPIRGRTCLQAAAEKGHLELVKGFLDSGAEVNAAAADKCGFTALQAAAKGGHLSVVKILLAAGAVVYAPSTKGGYSAVSAAVEAGNLEILQLFLTTGSPDGHADQVPPLLRASREGATDIVRCLIQAGANINALRTDRSHSIEYPRTALEAALSSGHEVIFSLIFNAGANIKGESLDLGAALGAAIGSWGWHVEVDIVRQLLDAGADVNRCFSECAIPLHEALRRGRIDLVRTLLEAGADLNIRTRLDGDTPLLKGVRLGRTDVIQVLLDAGADINGADEGRKGRMALQAAAELGNTSLVRFLLEQGADCNAPPADSYGVTALQAAAIKGHLPVALSLLKAGVNINVPGANTGGRKALEGAAEHGRLDIVFLLLRNDADSDGLESRCESAAKLAEDNGHILISKILREHKKDP